MHVVSEPNILYFGTPVVLIDTTNEDESSTWRRCRRPSGWAGAASSGWAACPRRPPT